ncbi:MAG: hypothetical protein IJT43_01835 [Stomatobaculum sp.]|nr:hypothetical protein [Stomatobaculum sp.]
MKKILMLYLALLLALGVFAGCSRKAPGSYEVLVNNEAGEPVPGVSIQFCSDTECLLGQTDDKGVAVFEKEAGKYTVHVYKVPEGYEKDRTEYPAPEKPGRVTIVLK